MNAPRPWLLPPIMLALALVQWLVAPAPKSRPEAAAEAAEPWRLPELARPDAKSAIAVLERRKPWGKLAEEAAVQPLQDPEWRFLGIMGRGAERYVLIKIEGQSERQLSVGDKLPGGSEILEIGEDALCLLVEEQRRRLPIYSGYISGPQDVAPAQRPAAQRSQAQQPAAQRPAAQRPAAQRR